MESVEYSTSFPPTLLPCRRNQQCFQRFSSREVTLGQVRKIGIQFIIYLLIDTVQETNSFSLIPWYLILISLIPWYLILIDTVQEKTLGQRKTDKTSAGFDDILCGLCR